MKLRLERAFQIASKIDFYPKLAPRPPPNRFQNHFQRWIYLGPERLDFLRLQEAVKFDFKPFWEGFRTLLGVLLDPEVVPNSLKSEEV